MAPKETAMPKLDLSNVEKLLNQADGNRYVDGWRDPRASEARRSLESQGPVLAAEVLRLSKALERIANYKWPDIIGQHREKYYGEATGAEYETVHHIPRESSLGAFKTVTAIARATLSEKQP
jgi:hypothetical protein